MDAAPSIPPPVPSTHLSHVNRMVRLHSRAFALALLLVILALGSRPASAQDVSPRFGLGFNTLLSTEDGLGFGFRGRVSAPINADLSFAADLGLTGFVLNGRDDATLLFDPQVSAIITLPPSRRRAPYILVGVGAYLPFDDDEDPDDDSISGPTLHGGIGWVQRLTETTLFYELNPALIIGPEAVDLALPFRIGVIF